MRNQTVRITSGAFRGRSLFTPGGNTHPMGAREKLALFNMLTPVIPEAKVLDAYAGSGALGLEVLSRGAKHVTFIESAPGAVATICQNIASLGVETQTTVISATINQFVKQNTPSEAPEGPQNGFYSVILVDPPYDRFYPSEVAKLAAFLAPGGILALSHPKAVTFNPEASTATPEATNVASGATEPPLPGCQLLSTHSYAAASISIFQKTAPVLH